MSPRGWNCQIDLNRSQPGASWRTGRDSASTNGWVLLTDTHHTDHEFYKSRDRNGSHAAAQASCSISAGGIS